MKLDTSVLFLPAGSPFRLDLTVWALRRRKANIVDQWDGKRYTRIAVFNGDPVRMTVTQEGEEAETRIRVAILSKNEITPQLRSDVRSLLRKMLGLTIDMQPFYASARTHDILKPLVERFLGVRPPRFSSTFEALVNSIACQQVTLDSGISILNRLSQGLGVKFYDKDGTSYAFPRPEDFEEVREEDIKKLGFSHQKARAIKELAAAVPDKKIDLSTLEEMDNDEATDFLRTIRGIGRWSAEYVLLRGLGRIDSFPGDDVGAQNNLKRVFKLDHKPGYEEIRKLTAPWRPYEGLVYFHLLLQNLHLKGVI
ncbi:MAG: DNA-3-methyladenine glycosylase 2 [Deltaproteobacteria bacterium]|jgi:DNA-3-methyladenine glycosylase II|nr:DNA-3-methyladenine glycosylase 2 [Deltaproteobacteria bacterium]